MRYQFAETETSFALRLDRRLIARRQAQLFAACAAWCALWGYAIAHLLPSDTSPPLLFGLMLAPLLTVPLWRRLVDFFWRLSLAKSGDSIRLGRQLIPRAQLSHLRWGAGKREQAVLLLGVEVAVAGQMQPMEFGLVGFDDRDEAAAIGERISAFLSIPLPPLAAA